MIYIDPAGRRQVRVDDLGRTARRRLTTTARRRQPAQAGPTRPSPTPRTREPAEDDSAGSGAASSCSRCTAARVHAEVVQDGR